MHELKSVDVQPATLEFGTNHGRHQEEKTPNPPELIRLNHSGIAKPMMLV